MTSGGVALWVAVLTTPLLIRWLLKNNIGQQIREDGPQVHIAKAGTPTMGGIGIVGAVVVGLPRRPRRSPGSHFSRSGVLVMLAIVGRGGHRLRRRLDQGAPPAEPRAQQAGQVRLPRSASALLFSLLAVYWAHASTTLSFTRYNSIGLHMGTAVLGGLGHRDHRRRRPTP